MKTTQYVLIITLVFALQGSVAAHPFEEPATEQGQRFITPLLGWGQGQDSDFHYLFPLYYQHHFGDQKGDLTLLPPLLAALYNGPLGSKTEPWKTEPWGEAGTWLSPYLAAGGFSWEAGDDSLAGSGAVLLPYLPFLEDLVSLHLYSLARSEGAKGRTAYQTGIALPGLGFSLYENRSAGIESDRRFLSFWDFCLYRSTVDLESRGWQPALTTLDTTRILRKAVFTDSEAPLLSMARAMDRHLDEARSGTPTEHQGLLDPLLFFERRGEAITAWGFEPFFVYDRDEGFSLPWLLCTFHGEGVDLGAPAIRHFFPLVHGNRDGSWYGFLANLATLHRLDGYTAFDIKLIFNYQNHPTRGCSWGFLPMPWGDFHEHGLHDDLRFVQFPGHALSYWNRDGERGFNLLSPLLGSWTSTPPRNELDLGPFGLLFNYENRRDGAVNHDSLWSLLHSYSSHPEQTDNDQQPDWQQPGWKRELSIGPLGLLFDGEWQEDGGTDLRFLLYLFGVETTEQKIDVDFLGIPLFRSEHGPISSNSPLAKKRRKQE